MDKFTTILWDVDGTLLDFLYSQKLAITKCFQSIGREITEDMIQRYSQINDSYWKRLELGEITKAELLPGRFTTLFAEYGIVDVDVEAFLREYQENLGNVYCYLDDSLKLCKELKARGIKQYVVTNGVSSTQRHKLELSGLAQTMEKLFISEEIGAPKPHKEFFEHCLSRVSEKDKSSILLVGDSLTSDIKGGILAGIRTCWYRPEGTENDTVYRPDYEISRLHQIRDLLFGTAY